MNNKWYCCKSRRQIRVYAFEPKLFCGGRHHMSAHLKLLLSDWGKGGQWRGKRNGKLNSERENRQGVQWHAAQTTTFSFIEFYMHISGLCANLAVFTINLRPCVCVCESQGICFFLVCIHSTISILKQSLSLSLRILLILLSILLLWSKKQSVAYYWCTFQTNETPKFCHVPFTKRTLTVELFHRA